MTSTVTVLGTGIMGAGMARSLARAGLAVTAWNRDPARARPLAEDGITVATEVADAVSGADVVLTMLFDSDAVSDVIGPVLSSFGPDTVWVQSSTVGLDGTAQLAELAVRHGVAFVDAPVLGTRQPAADGKLIVLAGGPESVRDRVSPVFDAIGSRTVWVGDRPGDGHRLKLVANSWVLSVTAATAQSIALATGLGLDPQLFLDAIADGPLDSAYAQLKGTAMLKGDFTPSFGLGGATKDTALILAALRDTGTDDHLMSAIHHLFTTADRDGHGDEDMAAVIHAIT